MTGQKIAAWEVVNHGIEHSQYFQGCGTSCTAYTDVATGIGMDAGEAIDDALESLAQNGWDTEEVEFAILADVGQDNFHQPCVTEDDHDEMHYHVSIRVRGE